MKKEKGFDHDWFLEKKNGLYKNYIILKYVKF